MSPTGTAPSARYGHTVAPNAAGDGFFIFGGQASDGGGLGRLLFFCMVFTFAVDVTGNVVLMTRCFVWRYNRVLEGFWVFFKHCVFDLSKTLLLEVHCK